MSNAGATQGSQYVKRQPNDIILLKYKNLLNYVKIKMKKTYLKKKYTCTWARSSFNISNIINSTILGCRDKPCSRMQFKWRFVTVILNILTTIQRMRYKLL